MGGGKEDILSKWKDHLGSKGERGRRQGKERDKVGKMLGKAVRPTLVLSGSETEQKYELEEKTSVCVCTLITLKHDSVM